MSLKFNFYSDIFSQEQKWIELINSELLNSVYCNLVLKPFYEKKRMEIENLTDKANNKILEQILSIIDEILAKLENFNIRYRNMESVDMKEILPLFLVNKMGNNTLSEDENVSYKKLT